MDSQRIVSEEEMENIQREGGETASVPLQISEKVDNNDLVLSLGDPDVEDNKKIEGKDEPGTSSKLDKEREAESSASSGSEDEQIFEVEKIIAHKVVKGKDMWRVRWLGYGPDEDTYEPIDNFLDEKVLKMLKEFEAERLAKKEKRQSVGRRSREIKQEVVVEVKQKQESPIEEDEKNQSWFGIKPDEGTREQRRLFVQDRVLTKTEKLLTEFAASPGQRILRKHVQEQIGSAERRSISLEAQTQPLAKKRRGRPSTKQTAAKKAVEPASEVEVPTSIPISLQDGEEEQTSIKMEMAQSIDEVPRHGQQRAKKEKGPLKEQISKIDKERAGKVKREREKELAKAGPSAGLKKQLEAGGESSTLEFGISKGLTTGHAKRTAKKKNDQANRRENECNLKPKHAKEKNAFKLKFEDRGANPLRLLAEGCSFIEAIALLEVERSKTAAEEQPISQQEFEEIVMDGKVEQVRRALETQKDSLDLNRADAYGKTLVHKLCEIRCAVSHSQCELIHLLVANGARLDMREKNNSQIPLHIAIANRRICHVRKLLELHSPVNWEDRSGKAPIIFALDCSDPGFLRSLLKAGASFQPAYDKLYDDKDKGKSRLLNLISEHESRLRKALNSARDTITHNMAVKCISQIFVNPIHERNAVHSFSLSSHPQLPGPDYAYLLFVSMAEFLPEDTERESCCAVEAVMWGVSPVQTVTMNRRNCIPLKSNNKFAFLCVPCRGLNQIEITLSPATQKSGLALLSQVVLAQIFRSTTTPRQLNQNRK